MPEESGKVSTAVVLLILVSCLEVTEQNIRVLCLKEKEL